MKIKLIFILFLMPISLLVNAQKKDSVVVKKSFKNDIFIGVDFLNAGISLFSDKKMYQGYLAGRVSKNMYVTIDAGYAKNHYDKGGYDADASGFFGKAGVSFMLITDKENFYNGFYIGPKIGVSFYEQEYNKIPVKGANAGEAYVSKPSTNQSSYWVEAGLGGRVQLFRSRFFIDAQLQPRYLLFSTKQEEIQPMTVPGFGRSSSKLNLGFSWSVAFRF